MLSHDEQSVLKTARVARLATVDSNARPSVVPICFAVLHDDDRPTLVTPIDEKPKTAEPNSLRRVRDIQSKPEVAVVIDHYSEDWDRLGWLQLRGIARVAGPPDDGHANAVAALRDRYEQYGSHDLENRPVITIRIGSVTSWGVLTAFDGE